MTLAPISPGFPPGRYGRRRDPARLRRRRWVAWSLGCLVVLAATAVAVKLYRQYARAPYQVSDVGVAELTDTAVTVTFEVTTPPGRAAVCTVRAHTRTGELVGAARVMVPAGRPDQTRHRVRYTLTTTARPVTGEVPGCGPPR